MVRNNVKIIEYDRNNQKPVIQSNVYTGEKVAGFRDVATGKISDIMPIRNNKELDKFLEQYDISIAEIKNEW